MTRLAAGLGNPGPEYADTRHNLGFQVLDEVARTLGLFFRSASHLPGYSGPKCFQWAAATDESFLLVKPLTFMNRSGQALQAVAEHLGRSRGAFDPAQELLVAYDDLDLPLGSLRIRPHGGHGGQNGMRSIIEHLGTEQFPRLRVGIGHPGTDAARHVLSSFSDKERVEAEISVKEAAEAILEWLRSGDLASVMTRFHSRWNP